MVQHLLNQAKEKVSALKSEGFVPHLAVVLVGDNPASEVYVRKKAESCEEQGIGFNLHHLKTDTTQADLEFKIQELNTDPNVTGILLQLPLPAHLDKLHAISLIHPLKDVDGLGATNAGKTAVEATDALMPATPLGIMRILQWAGISLNGLETVVIGRSHLVGQPMALLLAHQGATVTICHKETTNLKAHLKRADLIISATGCPLLVTGEQIKHGVVIVDVGINPNIDPHATCKIIGDVCDSVEGIASMRTPVPGGVGPMTVASLMTNIVDAVYLQKGEAKSTWEITLNLEA